MKALPHTALALALLTGGLLLGRGLSFGKVSTPRGRVEGKHDMDTLRVRFREWAPARTELQQEMERMGTEELKALGASPQPDLRSGFTVEAYHVHTAVVRAAAAELYRRGDMVAIEWAATLKDRGTGRTAMAAVLELFIQRHPEAAEPWIKRFHTTYGRNSLADETLLGLGLKAAAEKGADEVLRMHGMFPATTHVPKPLHGAEYPADFDFAKLHTELGAKMDLTEAISRWAVRDADAAWRAVSENLGRMTPNAGAYFTSVLIGVVSVQGEEAGMKWAVERLAELSPAQRFHCLLGLDGESRLSTEGLTTLFTLLPPEERKTVAKGLLMDLKAIPKACIALESLPRETMIELIRDHLHPHFVAPLPAPPDVPTYEQQVAKELRTYFALTDEEMAVIKMQTGL